MRCSNCRNQTFDSGLDCLEFLNVVGTDDSRMVKQSKTIRTFCDEDCRDDYYWPSHPKWLIEREAG